MEGVRREAVGLMSCQNAVCINRRLLDLPALKQGSCTVVSFLTRPSEAKRPSLWPAPRALRPLPLLLRSSFLTQPRPCLKAGRMQCSLPLRSRVWTGWNLPATS